MNNPVRIQFTNGNVTRYVYSAAGEKLRAVHETAVPNIIVPVGLTHELNEDELLFKDSTDYLLGGALVMKNGWIDKYLFDGGYCQAKEYHSGFYWTQEELEWFTDEERLAMEDARIENDKNSDTFSVFYYNRDHLGSVREVVDGTEGSVVQSINYYPFGMQYCDEGIDYSVQPYMYNGKEFDNMYGLNTYDYGARQYNPVTGRWDRMDPLCEKYYPTSPFAYCANNPVRFIDPDGRVVKIWYRDNAGKQQMFRFSGFHGQKSIRIPNNQFVKDVIRCYVYNTSNGGGKAMKAAVHSIKSFYIDDAREYGGRDRYRKVGTAPNVQPTVYWNPETGLSFDEGKGKISPATCLEHEFGHAVNEVNDRKAYNERSGKIDPQYDDAEEREVITGPEAMTARANGESLRNHHDGDPYFTISPISTEEAKKNEKKH